MFYDLSAAFCGQPLSSQRLFSAPLRNRRILAGFSYLQSIGKGAQTCVWFPDLLEEDRVEWAAVRQFELFREGSNFAIESLEVTDLLRWSRAWGFMRGGGYRVTVLTLGQYTEDEERDDLEILDQKIQEEITRLIHFLYLSELSQAVSKDQAALLRKGAWDYKTILPHIAVTLGAKRLFKPEKETTAERIFFEILDRLPREQVRHDIAMGLVLPEADKENEWLYIASPEHRASAFFAALGQTMNSFIAPHMRAHGDRCTPRHEAWLRKAAAFLDCAA